MTVKLVGCGLIAFSVFVCAPLWAQGGVADERSDRSSAFDEPDAMNVAQKARLSFGSGERQLAQARKIADKIDSETNTKKRSKLEEKRDKSYAAAIESFRESLAYEPTSPSAWAGLGTAYRESGKIQEALLAHVEGIKVDSDDHVNFLGWTEALMDGMMFGNATAAHGQFATENPQRAELMLGAISSWLVERRADPGDIDSANLDRLEGWIQQQKQ